MRRDEKALNAIKGNKAAGGKTIIRYLLTNGYKKAIYQNNGTPLSPY